jgi:hypothetical protein
MTGSKVYQLMDISNEVSKDHRRSILRWVTSLHVAYTAVAFGILFVSQSIAEDSANYTWYLCVAFTISIGWLLLSSYIVCRDVYHPYFLFLLSAVLFNGGQLILTGVGLLTGNQIVYGRFSEPTLHLTIILIFKSLLMLHLGVLVYLVKRRERRWPAFNDPLTLKAMRKVGYGIMIVASLPYLAIVIHELRASAEGYAGLYASNSSLFTAVEGVVGSMFLPGLLFAFAGNSLDRSRSRLLLAVALLDIGVSLLVGSRAGAIMLACALLFVWTRRFGRIPTVVTGALLICAVVTIPAVAALRDFSITERLSASRVMSSLPEDSNVAVAVLDEMGMSIATTAFSIDLVPEQYNFQWGMSYGRAVLLAIPGMGGILNSEEHPVMLADWLIREVDPVAAANNGGLGFSFIAEAYLNFGLFGGPVACGVIGMLIAYLLFRGNDALSVAFIGCVLLCLPLGSRAESGVIVRCIIWQCVLPVAAVRYVISRAKCRALSTSDNVSQA